MSENKRLFSGMKVPEPPEDLRRQVLSRARQAMDQGPRHDIWSRIWDSRQARLAWAASVLALAVCHLVVPLGDAGPAREPSPLARTEADDLDELAVIANLPRISLDSLPTAASTLAPEETDADPDTAAPTAVSEENES